MAFPGYKIYQEHQEPYLLLEGSVQVFLGIRLYGHMNLFL